MQNRMSWFMAADPAYDYRKYTGIKTAAHVISVGDRGAEAGLLCSLSPTLADEWSARVLEQNGCNPHCYSKPRARGRLREGRQHWHACARSTLNYELPTSKIAFRIVEP